MSAILSADDLNDFINPGVACIKPVETLPQQQPTVPAGEYEVTTEDRASADTAPPAQISLTDCLACSGCVTSAEAVLVSLQSHSEVLGTLDRYRELQPFSRAAKDAQGGGGDESDGKVFVASVSPQTRASLAATYNVSEREAGHMISQLLSGPYGLRSGGQHGSGFTWVIDTNAMREASLVAAAEEVEQAMATPAEGQKKPILTSACPGWICYAEKTHAHILPHLSKLKSPQALTGTLVKSVLAKYGIRPENVWHMAVMPCFDKKLEASRAELTSHTWHGQDGDAIRDVDCVITARELLMLAESRDVSFPCLPRKPLSSSFAPAFPDDTINAFLFGMSSVNKRRRSAGNAAAAAAIGTSGGYLHHILQTQRNHHSGSSVSMQRGRNADVSEYSVLSPDGTPVFRAARYYGFRNIQNLVRRLKPTKASRMPGASRRPGGARKPNGVSGGSEGDYTYVEVMACPGGCTNGGGQIKVGDVATLRQVGGTGVENGSMAQAVLPAQREWLARVDEAYFSADSDEDGSEQFDSDGDMSMHDSAVEDGGDEWREMKGGGSGERHVVDGIDHDYVNRFLTHWSSVTGVEMEKLMHTTYRAVESDVGKERGPGNDMEREKAYSDKVENMADDHPDKMKRARFPTDPDDFNDDDRVSYDQVTQSHKLEDELGEEWEWLPKLAKWVPVTDEALVAQQQQAYAVEGVDENEPAVDPRKRKAAGDESNGTNKKQKAEKPPPAAKKNNAIYVTSLPLDVDVEEIHYVFKKFGVIAESAETNMPRIKLYTDDKGNFKGDALIVYFRAESVPLAIELLDETDFRLGQSQLSGPMRVSEADSSFKAQKEQPLKSDQAKTKGTGANRDRQKVIKKNEEMNSRLADWDDDDPAAMVQVSSRWDKVVILKHCFTLEEIAEDPSTMLEIKEDIRDECEKFGTVTNTVMYDKEADGVVTVRFSDKVAAKAAVDALNGRSYDSRKIEAYTADGTERFEKSRKGETEGEAERLETFSKYLDGESAEVADT